MLDEQRDRVIARIRRLPVDRLPRLESFLTLLERGDSSPLFAGTESGNELPHSKDWPHAPVHRLSEHGTYIVTAGTYQKEHWFRGADRLDLLESSLLRVMKNSGWRLEAWAVFSNYYHYYVHQNAVKHGLVPVACQYRWCSAAWFERTATCAHVGTVYRFKIDKLKVHDDYEPI